MNETEQLTQLCERLGASSPQAKVMAAQLLKRADQLALERNSNRAVELARLLELLTKGHAGVVPKDFVPPPPRPAS